MKGKNYFIHTPTVSVGVNYDDVDGVDRVIGLFSSQSGVDVETGMQMMGRARIVKSKTYWVYADGATNNLPVLAEEIKKWLCKQVDIVTGASRLSPTLKFEFDEITKWRLPEDLFHRMYCHVTSLKHLSINNFRERLIQRMTQAGCVVTTRDDKLDKDDPIASSLRKTEAEITAATHREVAGAESISTDEFDKLSSGARDLDAARLASVHKFALMRTYGVQDHSTVTEEWVVAYDSAHEKEYFKNSGRCHHGKTLQECLILPQQHEELELEHSLWNAISAEAHSRLVWWRLVKPKFVVDVLTACGFEDRFATNEVLAADLKSRIDVIIWPEFKKELEEETSQIYTTLKIKGPTHNNWTFKNKLASINTILLVVLGAKISAVNKRSEKYILKHHSKVVSENNSPLDPRSAQ